MPRKRIKKSESLKKLKKTVSEILVASESDFRPYIEILNFTPENITQRQFGSLLGVFEIKDDEEDSAYIVNFLSSVAKKEYFASVKKSPSESFESALNKINLALSEIARYGNVQWIGKLDMAVCALEERELHFSVSGGAHVLLIRGGNISDISRGLSPKKEKFYPLKIFTDIASGKLENNDKIIVTTGDIFQILSLDEIKKAAAHFSREQFARFLKTALVNELEIAGTIIIDVSEESRLQPAAKEKKERTVFSKDFNAFCEKTFKESPAVSPRRPARDKARKQPTIEDQLKHQKEYVDKKTGHIYVHGESQTPAAGDKSKDVFYSPLLFAAREEMDNILYRIKSGLRNKPAAAKGALLTSKKFLLALFYKLKEKFSTSAISLKRPFEEKSAGQSAPGEPPVKTGGRLLSNLLPSFSRIKNELRRLDYQQKIYALLILTAIIAIPLIASVKFKKSPKAPLSENIASRDEGTASDQFISENKNARPAGPISSLYSHADLINPVLANNGKLFAITKRSAVEIKDGQEAKEFPMPSELGDIVSAVLMKDLNLIFLLTDKQKIVSFSPISRRFQENNIELPENSSISALAVYLTYIYLADPQNNQIYRYPRAEEGFGERANWLKENLELKNVSAMAIDGDIYLANGNSMLKLSGGKKQEFSPEESAVPISFNKIFTDNKMGYIYILDSLNGRLIKFSRENKIIAQYYDERIKGAQNFFVSEEFGQAYLAAANGELISFGL